MKGLVGFFDILGYQSFLENNSASETALDVLRIINEIPQAAKEITDEGTKHLPRYPEIGGLLRHLVFSDTIVFTLEYPKEADDDWIYSARGYISLCSANLASRMFASGLPIRGVLHEGDFITRDYCLAGRAIVEAYQLCGQLDFASLVFTKVLGNKIIASKIDGAIHNDSDFIFNYLAPMKNNCEMKLAHINWLKFLGNSDKKKLEADAENFVLSSFWAHQKDCPKSVDQKIHNTVRVMRKMLQNYRREKAHELNK